MNVDYVALGKRIKALRKQNKLSQAELAEKAGLSEKYPSSIECATSIPSIETIASISRVLEVSVDYLLFGSSSYKTPTISNEIFDLIAIMPEKDKIFIRDYLQLYSKIIK